MFKTLKLFARHHLTDKPYNGPVTDTHFKIEKLKFGLAELNNQMVSLGAKKLAMVNYKNKNYPIYCLDFISSQPGSKKLFVVAGTHGNEQGGLLGIQHIISYLEKHSQLHKVSVRIVATHNPVGCEYFSRYNGQGVDVNRDFRIQKTLETQAVVNAFNDFKPDFGLSLHEGPQDGVFLYTNKYCEDGSIDIILANLERSEIQLATKSYLRNNLAQPGRFPVNGTFGGLLKLWTGIFGYEAFGQFCTRMATPCIVIETPWNTKDESQRAAAHLILFKTLIVELNNDKDAR